MLPILGRTTDQSLKKTGFHYPTPIQKFHQRTSPAAMDITSFESVDQYENGIDVTLSQIFQNRFERPGTRIREHFVVLLK